MQRSVLKNELIFSISNLINEIINKFFVKIAVAISLKHKKNLKTTRQKHNLLFAVTNIRKDNYLCFLGVTNRGGQCKQALKHNFEEHSLNR